MNPATTTTSTLTSQIAQFWDKKMLTRLEAETQFYGLADKRPMPKGMGKTITFNRYANLAALTTALTEGTVPTAQSLTSNSINATASQYGGYVSVSDLLEVEAVSDVAANAVEVIGYQARLSTDTILRNIADSGATLTYAAGVAGVNNLTATDVLNAAEIRNVVRQLKRANVKPHTGTDYMCIIHPQSLYDLQSDTTTGGWLVANQYSQPTKIFNNEIGKMYGVRFLESTNAYSLVNTNTPTANCYYNYFFGKESFAAVDLAGQNLKTYVKKAGSAGSADPLDQINTVGWKETFTGSVLDAVRLIVDVAGSAE